MPSTISFVMYSLLSSSSISSAVCIGLTPFLAAENTRGTNFGFLPVLNIFSTLEILFYLLVQIPLFCLFTFCLGLISSASSLQLTANHNIFYDPVHGKLGPTPLNQFPTFELWLDRFIGGWRCFQMAKLSSTRIIYF